LPCTPAPVEILGLIERDTVLVAEEGGLLIGAVHTSVAGTTGYFGMLAVDASARRAGVGRSLLHAAEEHCRRAGCAVMTRPIRVVHMEKPL
jgi:GNAT superfamily N-acetyltransferase